MKRNPPAVVEIAAIPFEDADWFIANVAAEWWPSIDWSVTATLRKIGEPTPINVPAGQPALLPVDPHRGFLGCGAWGCVYPLATTDRWVVKITADPTEGPVVAAIMKDKTLRYHPGTLYYEAIWQLDTTLTLHELDAEGPHSQCGPLMQVPVYVVLREAADVHPYAWPWQPEYLPMTENFTRALNDVAPAVYSLANTIYRLNRQRAAGTSRGAYYRELLDQYVEDEQELMDALTVLEQVNFGSPIADFIRQMYLRANILLGDLHSDNLGVRVYDLRDIDKRLAAPGPYISMIDPGHSETEESAIPILPRKVAANPIPKLPFVR